MSDRRNSELNRRARGKKSVWAILAWALITLPSFAAGQTTPARVTYLANEGVLLEVGDKKVLIDALFGDGIRGYPVVPEQMRGDLEAARGRFQEVDLLLVSHEHRDHFDPGSVARHLANNSRALMFGPPDAVARLPDGARAQGVYPLEGNQATLSHRDISVRVMRLHHGRARSEIQNLGLIVDLNGVRFLHVGDTELTLCEGRSLELDDLEIDVALLPSWQIDVDRLAAIGARQVVAFHLAEATAPSSWFGPYASRKERLAALESVDGVTVFQRVGQTLNVRLRSEDSSTEQ